MNSRRLWLQESALSALSAAVLLLPLAPARAQGAAPLRVVLQGHDPVAYFTESRPVMGSPQFKLDWDDQRYHFANAANRDRFAADPDRYAPQFAGYCTGTMSKGGKAEADPQAWIIADGKLFLFGQVKFRDLAKNDPAWLAGTVVAANDQWRVRK